MWHRLIKFLLALAILPACWGSLLGFVDSVFYDESFFDAQWPFLLGFVVYAMLSLIWTQPLRTYVFGHELAHALWVWIFRGKVKGFSVSKKGGQVSATKSNFFIALAPYFFPVYSILVILIYLLIRSFWTVTSSFKVMVFFLGMSWAFHLIMTVYALVKDQEEVRQTGVAFSLVLIVFLNVILLGGFLSFTSPSLTLELFLTTISKEIQTQYIQLFKFSFS